MRGLAVLGVLVVLSCGASAGRLGLQSGPELKVQAAGTSCDTCLFSFRILDDVLSDPVVMQDLVAFVQEHICPAFGGGEKCTNLAEGLLPVVIDWIRNPATAKQFCKDTGACPPSLAVELVTQVENKQVGDANCVMCELVMGQVQGLLNNSAVLDKINSTAQQVCNQLPPDMAAVCSGMVNKYEPLIESLISQTSPKELCELIGLCLDSMHARLNRALLQPANPAQRDAQMALFKTLHGVMRVKQPQTQVKFADACDMCKLAIVEAHQVVTNPQIQESLTNYTESLCQDFGPSFADTCKLYVDTYAPIVFNILGQYLVPDSVCQQIGMCKPSLKDLLYAASGAVADFATSLRDALKSHSTAYEIAAQHMANAAYENWVNAQQIH